jgi:hypothetical protein
VRILLKKAQTATEYLIILAVVIVVALIVVGVMGGIPGIGRGAGKKASASYWKSADIAIDSYSVQTDGSTTLNVRNNLDTSVTLTAFQVNSVDMTPLGTLAPGQSTTLTGDIGDCSGSFSFTVGINFTDVSTSATYTTTGEGHKLEGDCAN